MTERGHSLAIHFLALGLLALFALLFFRGLLRGATFYVMDFHQTFQPLHTILGESLRRGWPLWNDRLNNGMPLLADPMQAALYLPNMVLAAAPVEIGLTLLTVLHVLFGACGVWFLGRRWGLGGVTAWTAAVVFGFNGVTVSATEFCNLAWSQAWLPWLILSSDQVWERAVRPPWSRVAGLSVVIASMLLLGDPFIVLAGLIGVAMLAVARCSDAAGLSIRRLWSRSAPSLLALILALLLAVPALAAYAAYVPHSERGAGFVPEGAGYWSFHPGLGLGLFLPGVFGDPRRDGLAAFWARELVPEKGFPLFGGFYVGSVVAGLTVLGATRAAKRRWPLLAWLGVLSCLALGRYGPIYPLLGGLPLANTIRYPMKWVLPAMLPVALLAGQGLEGLIGRNAEDRSRHRGRWILLAMLATLGALSVAASPGLDGWMAALVQKPVGGELDPDVRSLVRTLFLGAVLRAAWPVIAASGVLFWFTRASRRRPTLACLALTAIVVLDLGLANAALAPMVPAEFYRRVPPAVRALRDDPGLHGRVYVEGPLDTPITLVPPPVDAEGRARWERDALIGYVGAAYALDLAFNMDPGHFRSLAYGKLGSMVRGAPPRERLMLLGAAGVTHLVTYNSFEGSPVEPIAVIAGGADRPQRVSRNRLAVPRARLVPTLLPYEGDIGFMRAVQGGPDDLFLHTSLVERNELLQHGIDPNNLPTPGPRSAGEAAILEESCRRLRIRTRGVGGFLVVNDCLAPGWTATVDGVSSELLRADYAFRAVPVPAGEHDVLLRYSPW